jgi:hypothetical protein
LTDRDEQIRRQAEQIAEQQKQIADAEKQIADAEKQIADLERQLALRKQNSTNSSKPPSSDGTGGGAAPTGQREEKSAEAGRTTRPPRRASAAGAGRERERDPTGPAGPVPTLWSSVAHTDRAVQTTGEPRPHQVTELPPIQARTIEYQCHRVVCPECGESTRAAVPEEASGHFGPQLTALIAYLTVVCRIPRRVVEALLGQVLGIDISLGSTQKRRSAGKKPAKR